LFNAIGANFRTGGDRRLIRLPYNINEPPFAAALVDNFLDLVGRVERRRAI
jgi:uncharacterized protein (UPF0261 family)